MAKLAHNIWFLVLFAMTAFAIANAVDRRFNQYYEQVWGGDHFKLLQDGDDEVQLVLDKSSGAGFRSKFKYFSGRFHIKMKVPKPISKGVISSFYLISDLTPPDPHNELDIEFIGTRTLQTNVFANDIGFRERGFQLWFDPSDDFHSYTILWNNHQIIFFVDDFPVTVYKNLTSIGARYLMGPMHVEASLWVGGSWAGEVDWSLAPFTTYYRDFTITGCPEIIGAKGCDSSWEWNEPSQWELDTNQKQKLEYIEKTSLLYSYCQRSTSSSYPECSHS